MCVAVSMRSSRPGPRSGSRGTCGSRLQPASVAAPTPVEELRTQKVGDFTYFHVRLAAPKDMVEDGEQRNQDFFEEFPPSLSPRLVSEDEQVRLICQRIDPNQRNRFGVPQEVQVDPAAPPQPKDKDTPKDKVDPRRPVGVRGLEFMGRTEATGEVKMKLVYPIRGRRAPVIGRFSRRTPPPAWKEVDFVVDFARAKALKLPAESAKRNLTQPPLRDDLEGLWAIAQVDQFVRLDREAHEFGFYGFAATATARLRGVRGD